MSEDSWTVVTSKSQKMKKQQVQPIDISLDNLISKIQSALGYFTQDIVACFVYGSRARQTNSPTSDVDLLVFFKHELNIDDFRDIKSHLVHELGLAVDFVVCVHTKKWVEHRDERDLCYFEQLKPDAIQVMGTEPLSYLIETSRKLGKVK